MQTGKDLWSKNLLLEQFSQSGAECEQVAREIAAVHAGNIKRQQRSERSRLIPIVEMPAMPFEPLHRGKGAFCSLDQLAHRQIPKISGGQIGEQRQTHVRGRGARGNGRNGNFLKIVRGQPVLLGGDKGFKKMPRLAGGTSEKGQLLSRQIRCRRFDGLADPAGDPRSREPEAKQRQGQRHLSRVHP